MGVGERDVTRNLHLLLLVYLVIQIAGISYIVSGLIDWRGYLLGFATGFILCMLALSFIGLSMGGSGEEFVESLFSRFL